MLASGQLQVVVPAGLATSWREVQVGVSDAPEEVVQIPLRERVGETEVRQTQLSELMLAPTEQLGLLPPAEDVVQMPPDWIVGAWFVEQTQ